MAEEWVKVAVFAQEIGKTQVTVRQMAQHEKLDAKKVGKTWYIDRNGMKSQAVITGSRRKQELREQKERAGLEPLMLKQTIDELKSIIAEKDSVIDGRNGRVGALEEEVRALRERLERAESRAVRAEERARTWREALELVSGGKKVQEQPVEVPQEPVEALVQAWLKYREESTARPTYAAFAASHGVPVSEVKRAVRRARDRKSK